MSGSSSIGKSLHEVFAGLEGRIIERSAPAKVNLRLKVLGRRTDGYHLLSMLNCSTSLCDTVRLSFLAGASSSVQIEPSNALPVGGGENLVSKAWRAFWREFGVDEPGFSYQCVIEKRIPIGGGLGGGSSDAGVMFRVLAESFGAVLRRECDLSEQRFAAILNSAAMSCGADVPYAVLGGAAMVTGIGETVVPLGAQKVWSGTIVLMVPPVSVPTLAFYDYFRKSRPTISACEDSDLVDFVQLGKGDLLSLVENDFEGAVCELEPLIGEGLRRARAIVPQGTALTGSGSVFFSLIEQGREGVFERLQDVMTDLKIACHLCVVTP